MRSLGASTEITRISVVLDFGLHIGPPEEMESREERLTVAKMACQHSVVPEIKHC